MAKYYIQSGSIHAVVDSVDIDRAALWAVNEVMNSTLPIDELNDQQLAVVHAENAASHHLADCIRISERGFDRDDAVVIDTLETFRHWYELYQAVAILSERLR